MIAGHATPEGTAAYAKRHAALPPAHFRSALGVTLSSLGLGSYLGNADPMTDAKYAAATSAAIGKGINVLDSAINYRYQRSERNIGAGLKAGIEKGAVKREELLVCTKGGFLAGDWGPPDKAWFESALLKPGVITAEEVVAGCHCMTPKYLKNQVDASLANLGLSTIDVYYVHNPETQLPEVGPKAYYERLTAAFRALEECAAEGKIRAYGTATWNAYRNAPGTPTAASLEKTLACAAAAGGEKHRFQVVQLPFNFGLPEARFADSQELGKDRVPALEAVERLGLAAFTSVPLMQGQLLGRLSPELRARFPGLETDAQRCLQFARSTPGIVAPLCGMKTPEHVDENLKVAAVAPLARADWDVLAGLLRGE